MKKHFIVLLFFVLLPYLAFAGTVGKIKGKVTDLTSNEPLIGANVLVLGTSFGSATDVNGNYTITNLEAGTYQVRASFVGYQTVTYSNIRVNADLTTELNFQLPGEGIELQQVNVVAEKPLIIKSSTNASRITTSDVLEALPVRGLNNILALTPGVVLQDNTLFVRGGRQDEVGFYLEGASITDPVVGGRAITIVQDAIEEVQVQSGGYTAEYGGANAGIVYTQVKSGTPDLKASVEYITDNITFKSKDDRFDGKKRLGTYWYGYNEFTGTISGPVLDKRIKFFGLFNYQYQNDQTPQPYPGINLGRIGDPTTGDTIDFTYPAGAIYKNSLEQYSGTGTLSLDFNPLLFRLVGSYTTNKTYYPWTGRTVGNIANMLNLDRVQNQDQTDGAASLKVTHILNPTTFYELTGGYSFNTFKSYDPLLKDNYLGYGDSIANAGVGVYWTKAPGDNYGRFERPTRYNIMGFSFNAPGDVTSNYQKFKRERINLSAALSTQIGKEHSVKIGGEYQLLTIRNYSWGNEALMALSQLVYQNEILPAGDPAKITRDQVYIGRGINNYGYDLDGNEIGGDDPIMGAKKPVFAAFYVQDKIEYNDLIINIGLRYDYIKVDNLEFLDPTRPELSINYNTGEIILDGWKEVPTFQSVSPRLGLSFPVTDQTVFHAQFGKFVQQTRLRDMYNGMFATAYNLRGGFEITAPFGFNIQPTRTTQYEIGFTQQIGEIASFDITGFYKDIQDQVVFDKQSTDPTSPFKSYNILKNGDFATTKGVELAFNMRRTNRFQVNASVTFQDAQGTGSFPNSARGIVGAPLDGVTIFKPQYISPLEFNNSFRGNLNLDYRFGKDDGPSVLSEFGVSGLLTFNSGHPFTIGKGGADLEGDARDRSPLEALNSSTTPWVFQFDLRLDKTINIFEKLNANIYVHVINLFNTKNIENVFLRTGSTTDDGYISDPALGGKLVETYGAEYAALYRAINIDYYEQWQSAAQGAPITTQPLFYGTPRQIRLGIRLEY
ncbi:MAG: TonB-dependent receptor [Ignavibacteriaceae bacterium]|nr:TonB-dependent receptor [Ignavibacteriaceae bacterium]